MSRDVVSPLLERLDVHRANLERLLHRAAKAGGITFLSLETQNQICDIRDEIANLKRSLRSYHVDVPDHPDDQAPQIRPNEPEQQINTVRSARSATTIHLISVKLQKFDIDPDYTLDWRHLFQGDETSENKRLHQIKDPTDWNGAMLPQLHKLEVQINQETAARLIRVRGLARISPYIAFGHTFSEVARYTIEVDQQEQLWRTDAPRSPDFSLVATNDGGSGRGEMLDGQGTTVAVGISVNRPIDQQVYDYLKDRSESVAALLLLKTEPGYLRNAGDATALAELAKRHISTFVDRWRAHRLLFFYVGPLSGACFIGHRMNALGCEIQVMEHINPGYTPSFLLE